MLIQCYHYIPCSYYHITILCSLFHREKLGTVFDSVTEVNVLDSQDAANLALLARPDLGITFTKLHCWRLTQYDKCCFLDADTMVSYLLFPH